MFFAGRILAKKWAVQNDAADLLLAGAAGLALFGGMIFCGCGREERLLLLSGLMLISSALLAGIAYVKLRECRWVAAALPFTVLAFEVVWLVGHSTSFWDAMY